LYVVGNSISLSTAQEHVKSLAWASDLDDMKNQLQGVGFESVCFVLLFTGKQPDAAVTLRVRSDHFRACDRDDLTILEYPVVEAMETASQHFFRLGGMTSCGARKLLLEEVLDRCCKCTKGDCRTCECSKAHAACHTVCSSPA